MGPNFLQCDRDQVLLLPPSLREWLPPGHLAWFVIDAVERLDLTAFYRAYRLDGQGRPAHEPTMMVALLLYSYAVGERSSRRIERRCVEDVATQVICANQAPRPHDDGALFQRHERALGELFGPVGMATGRRHPPTCSSSTATTPRSWQLKTVGHVPPPIRRLPLRRGPRPTSNQMLYATASRRRTRVVARMVGRLLPRE